MRTGLIVVALAALVAASSGDAAARKKPKCPARQGHTLVRSSLARVWYVGDKEDGADYFGCLKSKGRVRKLTSTDPCFHTCESIAKPVRLNGRFVAWNHESSFSYGGGVPDSFEQDVEAFDLRSGRMVLRTSVPGASLAGLLLDRHGTVVFLSGGSLRRMDIGQPDPTEIDSGAIDPASLRLSGELVSWTNGGQPKSLRLR